MHHATEPACWSRWIGVAEPRGPGAPVAAGELLRTPSGSASVALFTAADAGGRGAGRVPWTSVPAWRLPVPIPARSGAHRSPTPLRSVLGARQAALRRVATALLRPAAATRAQQRRWLHDEHGMAYLDSDQQRLARRARNPAVVAAMHRQAAMLNTNSRFVYDGIADYAGRLAARSRAAGGRLPRLHRQRGQRPRAAHRPPGDRT